MEKIIAGRRQQVWPSAEERASWHEEALQAPATRGFAQALKWGAAPRIIAEFKRASPSKGLFNDKLQPEQQAQAYQAGGAVAISVLTEPAYFQGSRQDLQTIKASCNLPVLRKDFLVHPWEIAQSRCWGADAVLLIAAVLSFDELKHMLQLCQTYGLDALVEVHTPQELHMIGPLNPALIGINNRNLSSFQVELEVTRQLLPLLPDQCIKVSESGFANFTQLSAFPEIDAFLIGETLVKTADPVKCLQQLRTGDLER